MAILGPRNRTVYFRLSQDEFQKLATLCEGAEGARSVSELSRSAVRKLILSGEEEGTEDVSEALERVDRKINALNQKVERLIEMLHWREHEQAQGGGKYGE